MGCYYRAMVESTRCASEQIRVIYLHCCGNWEKLFLATSTHQDSCQIDDSHISKRVPFYYIENSVSQWHHHKTYHAQNSKRLFFLDIHVKTSQPLHNENYKHYLLFVLSHFEQFRLYPKCGSQLHF